MGFGLLFAGYVTLLFFKVMPPVMIIGALVMYKGLKKLSGFGEKFGTAADFAAVLGIYYALYTALWIGTSVGFMDGLLTNKMFVLIDDVVYYGILLAFHICLYNGLLDISRFCGYDKGIKKSYMSRVLMAMFYAFAIINIPLSYFGIQSYIPLAHFICQIVWIVYSAVFIYGCYMRIATDEIIAEEEKKIAEYDAKYGYKRKLKKNNIGKKN